MPMNAKCKAHYDKLGQGRNRGKRTTPPTPGSASQKRKANKGEHIRLRTQNM